MLILSRNIEEEVVIRVGGEEIIVKLLGTESHRAKLGFAASPNVTINRREVQNEIDKGRWCDGVP